MKRRFAVPGVTGTLAAGLLASTPAASAADGVHDPDPRNVVSRRWYASPGAGATCARP